MRNLHIIFHNDFTLTFLVTVAKRTAGCCHAFVLLQTWNVTLYHCYSFPTFSSSDLKIGVWSPGFWSRPACTTLLCALHTNWKASCVLAHCMAPSREHVRGRSYWITKTTHMPLHIYASASDLILYSASLFLFSPGQKIYCISAFMSQEWIEFVPFSANNDRQSSNLVENK